MTTNFSRALITRYIPKNSSKIYQSFPINERPKYPIIFDALLN